jgi:hypothetical protein
MRERIVFTGACLVFVFYEAAWYASGGLRRNLDSGEISIHFDASKAARSWSVSPYPTGQLWADPANPLKSLQSGACPRHAQSHWQQFASFHPLSCVNFRSAIENRSVPTEIGRQRKWPPPSGRRPSIASTVIKNYRAAAIDGRVSSEPFA